MLDEVALLKVEVATHLAELCLLNSLRISYEALRQQRSDGSVVESWNRFRVPLLESSRAAQFATVERHLGVVFKTSFAAGV